MTDRPTPLDPPARDEGEGVTEAEQPPGGASDQEADGASGVDGGPERRGVLMVLWGSTRRRVAVAVAAVVVVAAVVTTVIATTSGAARPVPSGEMPTLDSQFASPSPDPSAPSGAAALPAYSEAPLWTFAIPEGVSDNQLALAVTEHGFVVEKRDEIVGLDRTGTHVWRYTPPSIGDFTTRVTATHVFVSYNNPDEDRWPQPEIIIALDAATGTEVWREIEASFWSVTADTIYMSVCHGGQNNHIGDCTFSARDPRTNSIRWTVPTYASSRVIDDSAGPQAAPTPPILLIKQYPTDGDSAVVAAHDPATGALRGRGFQDADGDVLSIDLVTARTVVTVDDDDENPANGCSATLTGYSVSGAAQTWQYTASTTKTDDGRRCADQPVSLAGERLGVTSPNGAPGVLNLDTGAVEWSAPTPGTAIAAAGTTLLAVESAADGGAELVAYQVGNATPSWRAPFPDGEQNVIMRDALAVITSDEGEAAGYDLRSGTAWSYGATVVQVTATWLAVCRADTCRGYGIG